MCVEILSSGDSCSMMILESEAEAFQIRHKIPLVVNTISTDEFDFNPQDLFALQYCTVH